MATHSVREAALLTQARRILPTHLFEDLEMSCGQVKLTGMTLAYLLDKLDGERGAAEEDAA